MTKILMIYPYRCPGCHNCALSCSFHHDSEFRPHTSRIKVFSWEMEGFSMPTTCQQCEDAPGVAFCPPAALEYVDETDAARARKRATAVGFKKTFEEVK